MSHTPDAPRQDAADTHWNRVYEQKDLIPHPVEHPVLAAAMRHFGSLEGLRVCDVGCGTGEFALAFAAAGAEVTAIDRSETAIRRLGEWAREHGVNNLTPVCDDALGLADYGPFDRVFGAMILHHVEPFAQMAESLDAALSADGRAFFFENNAGVGQVALWFRQHLAGTWWFPKHGDLDEFPLTQEEVAQLRGRFVTEVVYPELALFRLVSHYIFRDRFCPQGFAWLDRVAYRFHRLRPMSYQQYLLLGRSETWNFTA